MAWQARLSQDITPGGDNRLIVSVDYYDDANPLNANVSATVPPTEILHSRIWSLDVSTSVAQLSAAVIREGQAARAAYQAAQTAKTAVPVGTIVAIP